MGKKRPTRSTGRPQAVPAPSSHVEQIRQAAAFHGRGQLDRAEALYREVLALHPKHFDALHLLGVVEAQRGNASAAAELIGRALGINAKSPSAFNNYGNALRALQRHEEALASYERAVALKPDYADAYYNRGNTLRDLRRYEESLASIDRALALDPRRVDACVSRGSVLADLGRQDEALAAYDRALAALPDYAEAHFNRAAVLLTLHRCRDAAAAAERALALRPDWPEALCLRGAALMELSRAQDALASYERAALLAPANRDALEGCGKALLDLGRNEEALDRFAALVEHGPDHHFATGLLLYSSMLCCDWTRHAALVEAVTRGVQSGRKSIRPFAFQALAVSPADLRRCAEIFAAGSVPRSRPSRPARRGAGKIRLGYVSGEFRQQATSILLAGLFEHHDRSRFELYAFDNGWDDGSEIRGRINRSFDEIVDIATASDREAAALVADRGIDIVVNLNGYFGRARTGLFRERPAPLQINYLGFPGTMGLDCIDYIIADEHVIPPDERALYCEQVVYLPDTYQANDSRRPIAGRLPGRAELGLPDQAFVFCCFNNNYKITPGMFDVWMRLLDQVAGSVLWLIEDSPVASRNLRREAAARGIAPERLVFAPRISPDEHLARHAAADLFLDTLPYNAHTTASDALWAGLPVLTCRGTTFPGRVGASLLTAIGLPQLVTASLSEYEAFALYLAGAPNALAAIKRTLLANRATHALFDTARYCRHLEAAYVAMWDHAQCGAAPRGFYVAPAPA